MFDIDIEIRDSYHPRHAQNGLKAVQIEIDKLQADDATILRAVAAAVETLQRELEKGKK